MTPALRKPNHGHQPRGHLAFPAIAVHLVKEGAVTDSAGVALRNERGGTAARRIGQANLIEDRSVPQHLLESFVRLPVGQQHPRAVPPDQVSRVVASQLLGISPNEGIESGSLGLCRTAPNAGKRKSQYNEA